MEYINTKFKIKKPYESPSLKIHKLRFEGALLDVSAGGGDQPWVRPSKRITPKPLIDDTYNIEDENVSEQEYDIKLF